MFAFSLAVTVYLDTFHAKGDEDVAIEPEGFPEHS